MRAILGTRAERARGRAGVMPDPDGGARIAFAEELPAYLQLAEGWLAAMAAASEDASREDGGLEGVIEALHERVAAFASLVADAREEYPSIVARCPVVILCTCPSLSTLRSIYAAASTLMRDIAYELEVERICAEQADAPERRVRILNEAAADYSSAASDWDAGDRRGDQASRDHLSRRPTPQERGTYERRQG